MINGQTAFKQLYDETLGFKKITCQAIHEFFKTYGFHREPPQFESMMEPSKLLASWYGREPSLLTSCVTQECIQVHLHLSMRHQSFQAGKLRFYTLQEGVADTENFASTRLVFEVKEATSKDIMQLIEQLVKTIKTSIFHDLDKEDLGEVVQVRSSSNYKFPVFAITYLESKFGLNWELEMSRTMTTPYWVVGRRTDFTDKTDENYAKDIIVKSYELYAPKSTLPIAKGAERETRYAFLLQQLANEGLSLFDHSHYLELASEGELYPSAGVEIDIQRLLAKLIRIDKEIPSTSFKLGREKAEC